LIAAEARDDERSVDLELAALAAAGRFEGGLTPRKYVALTSTSSVTAWRDIDDLVRKGLLLKGQGAGRSTSYDLAVPGWGWAASTNNPG
jgi:Fic family protein